MDPGGHGANYIQEPWRNSHMPIKQNVILDYFYFFFHLFWDSKEETRESMLLDAQAITMLILSVTLPFQLR